MGVTVTHSQVCQVIVWPESPSGPQSLRKNKIRLRARELEKKKGQRDKNKPGVRNTTLKILDLRGQRSCEMCPECQSWLSRAMKDAGRITEDQNGWAGQRGTRCAQIWADLGLWQLQGPASCRSGVQREDCWCWVAKSGDNSAHSRLWLWPHPQALLMQLRRERFCWDHGADEHRVLPLLLANTVIMYINTKCQNVSQLNGSLVPAPTAR